MITVLLIYFNWLRLGRDGPLMLATLSTYSSVFVGASVRSTVSLPTLSLTLYCAFRWWALRTLRWPCSALWDQKEKAERGRRKSASLHNTVRQQVAVINKLHAALDLSLCFCRCTLQCIDTKRICTCSMRPSSQQLFSSVIKVRRLNRFPILGDCRKQNGTRHVYFNESSGHKEFLLSVLKSLSSFKTKQQ